jgi:phosphoribosylanthranilate isomerase
MVLGPSLNMIEVKICGLTSVEDALHAVDVGADALGLNFWAGSPRYVDVDTAKAIVAAVGNQIQVVGVFVDSTPEEIQTLRVTVGFSWAQLHGHEPPQSVSALLPHAYKAIGVEGGHAVELARRYPGPQILLDASAPGMPGGTGRTFDWTIAAEVALERKLTLAGGLHADNVAEAVRRVRPFRVDVASGVESAPGRKDPDRVRAFVEAAKSA